MAYKVIIVGNNNEITEWLCNEHWFFPANDQGPLQMFSLEQEDGAKIHFRWEDIRRIIILPYGVM